MVSNRVAIALLKGNPLYWSHFVCPFKGKCPYSKFYFMKGSTL